MTHRLHWFLIGALIGGCTSAPTPGGTLPDYANDNLDVLIRSVAQPCGADVDGNGDGKIDGVTDSRYTFEYDALGRSLHDIETAATGEVYRRTDYTWDNLGHLTNQLDNFGDSTLQSTSIFDTLGRNIEVLNVATKLPSFDTKTDDIKHTDFDDLGNWLRGEETILDFGATTPKLRTRKYGYDELGRQVLFEVRDDMDVLTISLHVVFDDTARTISDTYMSLGDVPSGRTGLTSTALTTFDADDHIISDHLVDSDGTNEETYDTTNQWSGDRELSSTTTYSSGDTSFRSITTYKYECDASRTDAASTAGARQPVADHRPAATAARLTARARLLATARASH
jgi:hypothetical protein